MREITLNQAQHNALAEESDAETPPVTLTPKQQTERAEASAKVGVGLGGVGLAGRTLSSRQRGQARPQRWGGRGVWLTDS